MEVVSILTPNQDLNDSYGIWSFHVADHMRKQGLHVNLLSNDMDYATPYVPSIGGILMGYPTQYNEYPLNKYAGPRMWITTYESTKLPEGWVEPLNSSAAVVVSASEPKQWFEDNGVSTPIYSVPLGIDEIYKEYRTRPNDKPFRILVILDRGGRRGWFESLMTIGTVFGQNNPDIEVVLKTRAKGNLFSIKDDAGDVIEYTALPKDENITLIAEDYSNSQMKDLYHSCHAMLYLGREGFGLPPREFAATGGAAISLDWGGTADDIRSWGYPVAVTELEPAWYENHMMRGTLVDPEDQWAKIDVASAADTLKWVYETWDMSAENRYEKAEWVRKNYRWDFFSSRVMDIYKGIVDASA